MNAVANIRVDSLIDPNVGPLRNGAHAKQLWMGNGDIKTDDLPRIKASLAADTRLLTADFLEFSKARGNDLTTPRPEFDFPGLEPGQRWCLCAARWLEAWRAGKAPRVALNSTNQAALEIVPLALLKLYALDLH